MERQFDSALGHINKMAKIVLVSCASKKVKELAKAEDLYDSHLFKMNLKYAKSLSPDKIFILSAKYGLLNLDKEVEPYEETLNNKKDIEIKNWALKVLSKLKEEGDLDKDEFIFLAGEKYRRHLIDKLENVSVPMEGLGIGKQLKFLKDFFRGKDE